MLKRRSVFRIEGLRLALRRKSLMSHEIAVRYFVLFKIGACCAHRVFVGLVNHFDTTRAA